MNMIIEFLTFKNMNTNNLPFHNKISNPNVILVLNIIKVPTIK